MVSLELGDRLWIEPLPGAGQASTLTLRDARCLVGATDLAPSMLDGVPTGRDNLILRALELVKATAQVTLEKAIPPGAGLGGGSSDAAAVLRWAGWRDPRAAARLGADVPFCLRGARARVTGIGEELELLPPIELALVLVIPPFGVATPAVYRAFDALQATGRAPRTRERGNDLESAAVLVEPRLSWWKELIERSTGVEPHLAGSGSTWFVECAASEQEDITEALERSIAQTRHAVASVVATTTIEGSGSPDGPATA
jgi:4-diphosphocytidyl-2-C-methyl-D-erythritol kinase